MGMGNPMWVMGQVSHGYGWGLALVDPLPMPKLWPTHGHLAAVEALCVHDALTHKLMLDWLQSGLVQVWPIFV
jgi:hypothetical protein